MSISIIITAGDNQPIGACESFTMEESKTEDGYATFVKLKVPRVRFSRERIKEAFERGFFHVAAQIYPLHISVLEDKVETLHIHNAWISGITVSYTTDEWIIAEGVELEAESVRGTKSDQSTCTQVS